jgi:peptidyl-prolyl cis-trans isomerase A (cyclophilin A)
MRHALALLTIAFAAPAPAQTPPAPPPAVAPADLVRVTLTTTKGPIVLELDRGHAPVTVRNFLRYVDARRLDGAGFYRSMRLGEGGALGLVQFGTRNDPKRTFAPIAHEPTSQTGLSHTDGAISMAMLRPGTASGDFFIVVGDLTTMNATATDPGYAAFGRVVEGMELIHTIHAAPTSPTLGEGVMRGQMLAPVITIVTARRTPAPPAP